MFMNKGLKAFDAAERAAVHKEMKQLHDRKVLITADANEISRGDRREALKYLMFLKMKRNGTVKGQGCADGSKQRMHTSKEERRPPTVAIKSLMLS